MRVYQLGSSNKFAGSLKLESVELQVVLEVIYYAVNTCKYSETQFNVIASLAGGILVFQKRIGEFSRIRERWRKCWKWKSYIMKEGGGHNPESRDLRSPDTRFLLERAALEAHVWDNILTAWVLPNVSIYSHLIRIYIGMVGLLFCTTFSVKCHWKYYFHMYWVKGNFFRFIWIVV